MGQTVKPLRIILIAGEHSGDQLGAKLMEALKGECAKGIIFAGVGGELMEAQGLSSFFPLSDVAVMGITEIFSNLPRIVKRVYRCVAEVTKFKPDCVVIIDSPEFTHPIAKRLRKKHPDLPIINYVSPSVWAWRPGRAKRMKPYIDHVMGLLPFEPEAYQRLNGPTCSYVGHPLIEKLDYIARLDQQHFFEKHKLDPDKKILVVLPGSRSNEVRFLMADFGRTVAKVLEKNSDIQVIIPAVQHVLPLIEEGLKNWPIKPVIVQGEDDKFLSFRLANAALAASGTVTLELALNNVPMVVAYKMDGLAILLRPLVKVHSIILANLVLGENIFPEFLQEDCTPEKLEAALWPLLSDTPERSRQQTQGLDILKDKMLLKDTTPSKAAAAIVLSYTG